MYFVERRDLILKLFFYLQDIEMNIEELEGALQVVNHNLISDSEFDYLYQVRFSWHFNLYTHLHFFHVFFCFFFTEKHFFYEYCIK